MNFIEAHMIWHDFVDCLASKRGNEFRRESELKNTKEDITTAFKICIAHMMFIEHASNEKFQLTQICSHSISLFLPDDLVFSYEHAKLIGDDNVRSFAFSRINDYISSTSRNNEIDSYVERLVEYFKHYFIPRMKEITQSRESYNREYPSFYPEFVSEIYKIANLDMEENDGEYFWKIEQLRSLSNNPKLSDLFPRKYVKYLFSEKALR